MRRIIFLLYTKNYKINLLFVDNENMKLVDNIIENDNNRINGIGTEGMKYLLNFIRNAKYKKYMVKFPLLIMWLS
jgi:hypothetical protein